MRIGCVVFNDRHLEWAKQSSFDYLEVKGDFLLKLSKIGNIKALKELGNIAVEAMTSPLPREFGARVVGDDANHVYALAIFAQMLDLAAELGVRKVVLGSGQARNVPENFKREKAYEQLIDFINKAMELCVARNQILTIEPLHCGETNLINSCAEAQEIIKDIPGLSITADCYHIFTEKLCIKDELQNTKVMHAHTSSLPRGTGVFREEYQREFLTSLKRLGCHDVSIEDSFDRYQSMDEMLLKLRQSS